MKKRYNHFYDNGEKFYAIETWHNIHLMQKDIRKMTKIEDEEERKKFCANLIDFVIKPGASIDEMIDAVSDSGNEEMRNKLDDYLKRFEEFRKFMWDACNTEYPLARYNKYFYLMNLLRIELYIREDILNEKEEEA